MNPTMIIELLGVATQLINTLNKIKAQAQKEDPALWAQISGDFNRAVAKFEDKPQ